jgi:hypothetical protein
MTPKEVFEDSFRIAELLLHLHRLLENDGLVTEGDLVIGLREMLGTAPDEQLQLVLNSLFLGCIREGANVPTATMRPQSLSNLLRQAVVSGCTAYETYLSTILATHIFTVIELKQHEFFPNETEVVKYFDGLSFSIGEAFRLMSIEERAVFLGNKIVTFVQKKNLGSVGGLKTVGLLLGLDSPWDQVAHHLGRERKDVTKTIADCIERRNAIVHRADRNLGDAGMEKQAIAYAWTRQAVDTIGHVCLAFDELVTIRMSQFQEVLDARKEADHV